MYCLIVAVLLLKMPKLHHISKKFLTEQGYIECLANGERIQRQEEDQINNPMCPGTSNNQHEGGGESLLNGNQKEKSKINTEMGVKRSHPNVEASSTNETNQNISNGNHNNGCMTSTTSSIPPAGAAAAGAFINLQIRNQNTVWIRIGITDHPAQELYNPDNPDNDGSQVWVQYLSNGVKQCVSRSQIKHSLQDRKRHRPAYYNGCIQK